MGRLSAFFNNLGWGAKGLLILAGIGLLYGAWWGYNKINPQKVENTVVKTRATGVPPLAYDQGSNAPFRELPSFNEPANVQSPQIIGGEMGWNAITGLNGGIGGLNTAKGSIAEELGLNINLTVQNSCDEQANQLYSYAQSLHGGNPYPNNGYTFVNWMGDGVPRYLPGLNERLIQDFGPEYRAEVIFPSGASFGEDKWMIKPKYAKDARGSLNVTVIGDGDGNIIHAKCQLMGWPVNNVVGTYDRNKVNFYAAPNGDYVEAGKVYISGQKVTVKIVEDGKYTGKDTQMTVSGVGSWFPVDQQIVQSKGGMITLASTAEFGSQMACMIIMIKKWADDNRALVEKMIEMTARAGDQVKSHDDALQFAAKVNEVVFADKEKTADDWYKGYKSFELTDDADNTVKIGGSRVFNMADMAYYTGLSGGTDIYRKVYTTFGNIIHEAYPALVDTVLPYEEVVDWSFLRAVYSRMKDKGSVSKVDFTKAQKTGEVVGDASYAINFKTGSAEIDPSSYPLLDKIGNQLGIASETFVEVSGHTDNTGDPSKNQTLSELRAASIVKYLIGLDREYDARISPPKGYGSSKPLDPTADQNSPAARAKNRRVEIKLVKAK